MAATSSYFPNTARPKRGRPERMPPPSAPGVAFPPSTLNGRSGRTDSVQPSPYVESIRVILPESAGGPPAPHTGAHEPLRFPSSRTALWDRTPLGSASTLRAVTPRLALPAGLIQRLAQHALVGASDPHHATEACLRFEPDQAVRPWTARSPAAEAMLRPLNLCGLNHHV